MATMYTLPNPHGVSLFKLLKMHVTSKSVHTGWLLFLFLPYFFFFHCPLRTPKKPADVLTGNNEPTAFFVTSLSCSLSLFHMPASISTCFHLHLFPSPDQGAVLSAWTQCLLSCSQNKCGMMLSKTRTCMEMKP